MLNNRQQSGRRRGRGGQRQQGNSGRPEQGNRIDNRARGNAPQMLEKFKSLARDAQQAGDRVMTEYYLQFADHYFRVVAEQRARYEEQRRQRDDWRDDEDEGGEGEERGYASDNDDDGDGEGRDEDRGNRQNQNRNTQNRDRNYRPRDDDRPQRPREDDRPQRNRDEERMQRPRDDDRPQRPRRDDRYRRDDGNRQQEDAPATIDIAVLPPAFGSDGPLTIAELPMGDEGPAATQDEAPPAPRRRGRPKRETVSDEAA